MDAEYLSKLSDKYSNSVIARAFVAAIPYAGGSLDIILSNNSQRFEKRRIEKIFDFLHNELSAIAENKINKSFLESEEGYDLIYKATIAAKETRQNEKLLLYARIVKSALNNDKTYKDGDPELFLKIIQELSVSELRVSWLLYKLKANPPKDYEGNDSTMLARLYPEYTSEDLVSIFLRLEKTGLIKELVGSYIGYGGGTYNITNLFKRLIEYIETME